MKPLLSYLIHRVECPIGHVHLIELIVLEHVVEGSDIPATNVASGTVLIQPQVEQDLVDTKLLVRVRACAACLEVHKLVTLVLADPAGTVYVALDHDPRGERGGDIQFDLAPLFTTISPLLHVPGALLDPVFVALRTCSVACLAPGVLVGVHFQCLLDLLLKGQVEGKLRCLIPLALVQPLRGLVDSTSTEEPPGRCFLDTQLT